MYAILTRCALPGLNLLRHGEILPFRKDLEWKGNNHRRLAGRKKRREAPCQDIPPDGLQTSEASIVKRF